MSGKPKFTAAETVALEQKKRDDPDLDAHMHALVTRLEDVPGLYLRSMCAGFILGSADSYEEAVHTLERSLAMMQGPHKQEDEPS